MFAARLAEKLHVTINGGNAVAERRERERPGATVAKRGIVTFGVISIILLVVFGAISLQSVMLVHTWSAQHLSSVVEQVAYRHLQLNRPSSSIPSKLLTTRPTVQEAYESHLTNVSKIPQRGRPNDQEFRTVMEPNRNVKKYGLTGVRNLCMRPADGRVVAVGISEAEILAQAQEYPDVVDDWISSYMKTGVFAGVGFEEMATDQLPEKVRWVHGTTTHIIPSLNNVFHNFADRVWPHIAGFQYPLNETAPHPIHHFLVHSFGHWFSQAGYDMDKNTFLYQIRVLGELAPRLAPKADFLVMEGMNQEDLVCFERFVLACTTCDRMSDKLGKELTKLALLHYRHATFSLLGISEPALPLPPRPLRVTFYARGDTKRRQVSNARQVVDHLKRYTYPPLDVTFVDELLASGEYNQSFPEIISLLSQTDIFITVHGANTWAALFMPKHGGVIEIEGPCGPYSWLSQIVNALDLKHDTSNPWGVAVASPIAGNVTECKGPHETPDFTLDLHKLDAAIHGLALPIFGLNDTIPRHWLYNWS